VKYRNLLFSAVLALALSGASLAIDFTDSEAGLALNAAASTGIAGGGNTVGYAFTLDAPRTLTHLGLYARSGKYPKADIPIGIWDASGTLLGTITIPNGDAATIPNDDENVDYAAVGKFIYRTLDAPVDLDADELYTIGAWHQNGLNAPGTGFNYDFGMIPGVTYQGSRDTAGDVTELTKPTIDVSATLANGLFGPIFRLSTTIFPGPGSGLKPTIANAANGTDLDFTWKSKSGKLYSILSSTDLASDPATWSPVAGATELTAAPPTNMLTLPRPVDGKTFYVVQESDAPPLPPLLADDFEGDDLGWTVSNDGLAGTDWSLDNPAGGALTGPLAAASPSNCYGTNIRDDYQDGADISLISPPIAIPAGGATLTFQQWIDTDVGLEDTGTINILDAVGSFLQVLDASITGADLDWAEYSMALPASVNGTSIKLQFQFISPNVESENWSGWYIDDVLVEAN